MNFHEKCLQVAKQVYDKNYGDLEDEQCAIVSKIVRMDENDEPATN